MAPLTMTLTLDLHVHTKYSHDGYDSLNLFRVFGDVGRATNCKIQNANKYAFL